MLIKVILSIAAGYLLGSLNAALIVSKAFYKKDIREFGSGNAGLTNVLRTFGKGAATAVLALDFLKGILACFVGQLLTGNVENMGWAGMYLAGFAAVIGHNWPVFFGFRGGKGCINLICSDPLYKPPAGIDLSGGFYHCRKPDKVCFTGIYHRGYSMACCFNFFRFTCIDARYCSFDGRHDRHPA